MSRVRRFQRRYLRVIESPCFYVHTVRLRLCRTPEEMASDDNMCLLFPVEKTAIGNHLCILCKGRFFEQLSDWEAERFLPTRRNSG